MKICYFAFFVATTSTPVPHTSAMTTSPADTGSFTRVVLRAWATENTFSLGTSHAVRTDTTGAVPPVQRTVPVTVRTGATHSFRA